MSKYPNSRQNTTGVKTNEATTAQTRALGSTFDQGRIQSVKESHPKLRLETYTTRKAPQKTRNA